jgi:Mn2+/Fe2+ NRAMP family transporter
MVVVIFPIHWVALLLWHQNNLLHFMSAETIQRLGQSALVPCAAIVAGASTAPQYRLRVAIVLAALLATFIPSMIFVITQSTSIEFSGPAWSNMLKGVLWAGSIVAGVFVVWRSQRSTNKIGAAE